MKKITYIVLFASVMLLTGCSEDFELNDNDQGLNVEFIPGKYVAFGVDGASVNIAPVDVTEGDGTAELNVEVPTGSTSNVTINYIFGGTAVYGTDFTVTGGSSAGGTVVIVPDPGDDPENLIDNADITIELLTDGVADGDKTIIVTLVSASNANGEVLVGRGGKDILKTAVINIADID